MIWSFNMIIASLIILLLVGVFFVMVYLSIRELSYEGKEHKRFVKERDEFKKAA